MITNSHTHSELIALQLEYDKLKERLAHIERNLRGSVFEVEVEDGTPKRTRRGICKLSDGKPKSPVMPLSIPMSQNLSEDPSEWKEIVIDSTMKIRYDHAKVMNEIMADMDTEFFKRLSENEDGRCWGCYGTGRVRGGTLECVDCRGTGIRFTCESCRKSKRPGWIWTGMDGMKWIPCSECNIMQLEPLYPKVPYK